VKTNSKIIHQPITHQQAYQPNAPLAVKAERNFGQVIEMKKLKNQFIEVTMPIPNYGA
jgi:hypothetical protein